MITNERQYRITNAELKRFEEALAERTAAGPSPNVHPRIHQAMLDAMASERDELRAQLDRYDDLRSGRIAQRTLNSWRELPIALIEARIAARLDPARARRAAWCARAAGPALGGEQLRRRGDRATTGDSRRASAAGARDGHVHRPGVT